MERFEWIALLIPFVLLLIILVAIPISTHFAGEQTGICVFKGPATTGLFSSSDGIPLRGIGVTIWHPGGFGGRIIDGAGSTDRMGCFSVKVAPGFKGFGSYIYNGTEYIDNLDGGVILRDNLP